MRIEIMDGDAVINTIISDQAFAEQHYPGAWRVAELQDEPPPVAPPPRHITVGAFFDRFGPDFVWQDDAGVLDEIALLVDSLTPPQPVIFRSNHASNALPLAGTLTNDRAQVLAQIELWTKHGEYAPGVYILPKHLDEKVARLHLARIGVRLTELKKDQADYIGVTVAGPFKPEHYRY